MKTIYLFILYLFAFVSISGANNFRDNSTTLQGTVKDAQSGDPLPGVTIYIPQLKIGAYTDSRGKYIIKNLPKSHVTIELTFLGHKTIVQSLNLAQTDIADFKMEESAAQIDEVVVSSLTGSNSMNKIPSPVSYISNEDLERTSSTNIIDAIAKQPGISQITTGSGISKPVIRGLGYNRVVVVNDGVRQEGQQWGDEHGIEIDPQSVYSVEILKGPASLMYGSDAMAGIIDFKSAPTLPEGVMRGNVSTEYQTNSGLFDYSLNFAGNKKGFVWNGRYSNKMAHAYKNPYDGYVFNSGFTEQAFTGMLGLNKAWGYSHLTLSYYHFTPGIVEGARDPITGQFVKDVDINGTAGTTLATNSDFNSYGHRVLYQQIHHYKAVWDNNFILGNGNLSLILGYQQNRRQEFANILTPNQNGLYFQLHTLTYDAKYTLPEINGVRIVTGVGGMYQRSLNKGIEFLIPAYSLFDIGGYVLASRDFGNLNLSGGIRVDNRHDNAESLYLDDNGVKVNANDPNAVQKFSAFTKDFTGVSGSLGATYQFNPAWDIKLNLSKGFRAPTMNELGANGVHDGTVRYEIGNIGLKAENSWQGDLGLDFSSKIISFQLSLFANRINNYIFYRKVTDANGKDVITQGCLTYEYTSGNARLLGGELSVDLHPVERLHFQNSFSYVSSVQLNQPDSSKYLPFTPAPKIISVLRYDFIKHGKVLNNTYASIGLDSYFKQDKVYAAYGTETVTPGYALLNASVGTDFVHKGRVWASLYLSGENLLDKAYQDHLSRLKYLDVNNATGRMGVFNPGRSLGLKLIVPIDM